jgi:hypothetical protein
MPAPVDWPTVLKAMTSSGITLLIISTVSETTTPDATPQHKKMLTELGQPTTDIYVAGAGAEAIDTAVSGVLARIKAMK